MPELPSGFRLVSLCGSIKPQFSGVDDFEETLAESLRARGIDVHPIDLDSWGLQGTANLLREVAAARPDAILMQYPTEAFGYSLGPHVFATLQRIAPLIVTLHEFTLVHALRRLSIGLLLMRAAIIVVTAEREAQSLIRWFPWLRRRLRVIPIGANVPSREWAPGDSPEIVYFGQIRPNKGLEQFLACHDRLTATMPEVKFTIIGSAVPKFSEYFDEVVMQARTRAIPLVTGLDREKVSDRLSSSWVALLPFPDGASFRRGSLLAAAVCGVPIVTISGNDTPPNMAELLTPARSVEEAMQQLPHLLMDRTAQRAAHEQSCKLGKMVGWSAIRDSYIDALLTATQSHARV